MKCHEALGEMNLVSDDTYVVKTKNGRSKNEPRTCIVVKGGPHFILEPSCDPKQNTMFVKQAKDNRLVYALKDGERSGNSAFVNRLYYFDKLQLVPSPVKQIGTPQECQPEHISKPNTPETNGILRLPIKKNSSTRVSFGFDL